MTNQYERDMLEKMLELASTTESCLLHENEKALPLNRSTKRKCKPKKVKGAKYFFRK